MIKNPNLELLVVMGIASSKLYLYYSAADVLILTSFHEGSPNVIKEAMACNCPIVSTKVGDVEWITSKTEGCYIAERSIRDVADKLERAIYFANHQNRTNGRERIISLKLDDANIAQKFDQNL